MERKVLLLGLLRTENSHGYHLMEVLEQHIGMFVGLTKPTAYRLLEGMLQEGWLTSHEEREGRRPTKTVYTITEEGRRQFIDLLRNSLERYQPPAYPHDFGLMFLDALPAKEIVTRLKKRLEAINSLKETYTAIIEVHPGSVTMEHQLKHLKLDQKHIEQLINQFEQEGDE